MKDSLKEEIENFQKQLKNHGSKTVHNLLSALLIWLFGNLVFIPLAITLNWQTGVVCTFIFFVTFTLFVLRALPGLKKLINAFSVFPARKFSSRKKLSYESSLILSQNILYIVLATIFYLLYSPFLANFHPSVNGIVLILVIIWIGVLASRILLILLPKTLEWLYT